MKQLFIIILGFLIAFQGLAQSKQSKKFAEQYQKAKTFLNNKEYQEAILSFDPLLKKAKGNIYQEYAHFYSALCYFHLKKWKEAERLLEKLSEQFPQWDKMQEVLYLQANIAFERKEDNIALSYLEKIKGLLKTKAENMKAYYLGKREVSVLKNLQAVYPNDKLIAQILVDKLAVEVDNIKDLEFLEELVQKYDLEKPEKIRLQRVEKNVYRRKSDTLNIALFLPVNFKDYKDPKKRTLATNLSVDFYQGMRIAQKIIDTTLKKPTRLIVYDVYQNPDTLELMYKNNEFVKVDMFVGPFYDEDFAKALEIAEKKDIPIINPFLTNPKFLKSKNAYFLQPSVETQGKQSARFAVQNFGKNVIIFHSELGDETKLLNAHKAELEKLGGKILHQHKISVTTIPQIEQILTNPEYKEVNYVFVTSSSQAAAEKIMEVMKNNLPNVPILTTLAWRKIPELKPADLEKQNVHFIDPDYTRLSGDREPFRVEYNQRVRFVEIYSNMTAPPVASHKGYDVMVSFVKYLHLYPKDFYKKIADSEDFKRTFRGYLFTENERDNQYVPILKFADKKLVVANPLSTEPVEPKPKTKKEK
ncbi:MAG: ABC transporter substrate-binding protein [Raineya sp.]|nr:ABC transporter substrate-binding protein [Raineya sp.]MDW8297520.1 ABC transporter substrate-binding protein [Raineya sp.]